MVPATSAPGVQKRSAQRVAFAVTPKASLRYAFGLQVLLAGMMIKAAPNVRRSAERREIGHTAGAV